VTSGLVSRPSPFGWVSRSHWHLPPRRRRTGLDLKSTSLSTVAAMEKMNSTEVSDVDARSIREVVSEASESQSELAQLMALHTPDTVVVNFPGRRVLGRDALAEVMRAALASTLADVRTTVEIVDIRLATPDVAVVSCVKTVEDRRSDAVAPLPASTGSMTYVMVRSDDSWRIALAQTTPILTAAVVSG